MALQKGLGFIAPFLLLCSCSSLNQWSEKFSGAGQKKIFAIDGVWVRQTLMKENEGFRKINRMSPLLVNDLVIQGNSMDGLNAYRQENGRKVWHHSFQEGVEASAVASGNKVFVATSDGQIAALDAGNGDLIWTTSTKAENLAQPLFDPASSVLFVLAGNNVVHALNSETGRVLWIYSRQDTSSFSIRGGPQPLLKDGLLYVGFSEGSFVALNAKSGTLAWEMRLNKSKRFRDIDASAVLDQDRLYVSGFDDRLYALSLKGDIIWRLDEGGYSPVKVQGDRIYYSTTLGRVLCVSKIDGKIIWSHKLKDGMATQVQLLKGLVSFGESQGSLVFLNSQDGSPVGSFEPGRGVMSTPTIDENKSRVYFISGEANLYALNVSWKNPSHFGYLK